MNQAQRWPLAREETYVGDNLLSSGRHHATEKGAVLLMHFYRRLKRMGLERKDANGNYGTVEFLTSALAKHPRVGANR